MVMRSRLSKGSVFKLSVPLATSALPYVVSFEIVAGDNALVATARDASSLYKLRKDAPPDGDALARRSAKDFAPSSRIDRATS